MKSFCLDLHRHTNAHAATFDCDRSAGFVNAWRNSFPAEEMPFGDTVLLGGTAFELAEKTPGTPDHVEALEQTIEVDAIITVHAVGILGFGELGDQALAMTVGNRFGDLRRAQVVLPNWLEPKDAAPTARSWRATHLHYPDYERDHLRPCLFGVTVRLSSAIQARFVTLHANPLAHVMAVSLLFEGAAHA
jgi:hypothetical protein